MQSCFRRSIQRIGLRLAAVLPLIATITSGQDPDPVIAYYSRKSAGHWVDKKNQRTLGALSPIYSSSKLERVEPFRPDDQLVVSLPNGEYPSSFKCRTPLACDPPLDLSGIRKAATPQIGIFTRVVTTMGGRRGWLNPLREAVIDAEGTITGERIFARDAPAGTYSLSWCFDALSRPCPENPAAITVKWDPARPQDAVNLGTPEAGLDRLRPLRQSDGRWVYDDAEDGAYVLVFAGPNASGRVAVVSSRLADLQDELGDHLAENRARVVTLLAVAADRRP
jgi:hypothetical protein